MPARRLLGGGLDLTADENQVYLFMVLFGAILFGTPPLLKLWKYCRPHAASTRDPPQARAEAFVAAADMAVKMGQQTHIHIVKPSVKNFS